MEQQVREVVGELLSGAVSLDDFVRWCAGHERNMRATSPEVHAALRDFADGVLSVDLLYGVLCDWWAVGQETTVRAPRRAERERVAA